MMNRMMNPKERTHLDGKATKQLSATTCGARTNYCPNHAS